MVVSLLLLSAAQAATPEVYWDPQVPHLGEQGLLSGEFDGHAGLDLVATYPQEGEGLGLVVQLSGAGETWILNPLSTEVSLKLREGQWDQDAELELLIGLPDHAGEGDLKGAAWVLDLSGKAERPESLEEWIVLSVSGTSTTAGFGTDLQLLDCNSAEGSELIVTSPSERGAQVRAYGEDADGQPQSLASWSLKGSPAFGVALQTVVQGGESALAIAGCGGEGSCESEGALYVVSANSCEENLSLAFDSALYNGLVGLPRGLHSGLSGSSSFSSSLVWAAPENKQLLDIEGGGAALSLSTQDDQGAFVQSLSEQNPQTWVVSNGQVWQIEGLLSEGEAEHTAHRSHSAQEVALGGSLVNAGDLDEDGCEDVLSTSATGAVYLLLGCEEEETDTGDTGKDTGRDTGGDTGGVEPCEESFGWSCSSTGPRGFGNLSLFLVAMVFWASRRRKTE